MLGSWLVVSKARRGVFHQQASPCLFLGQQGAWSPRKKHIRAQSLEVQPQHWHSITLSPKRVPRAARSKGWRDELRLVQRRARNISGQVCNLPQSWSVELGVVNTWMATDATGVGAVSQGDGYGEKRRGPRALPRPPRDAMTRIVEEPTVHI